MVYRLIRLIIPVVTTTAAAAVVATLLVTASATTAAAAEASLLEASATAALLFWLGLIDNDLTTHHFTVVQVGDRLLSFAVVFHFDKTETLAAAGDFVLHDLGRSNCAVLLKKVPKILIGHLPGEVAYINVHCTKIKNEKNLLYLLLENMMTEESDWKRKLRQPMITLKIIEL